MLIIDRSGSMNNQVGSTGTKLQKRQNCCQNFVDIMAKNPQNHVGLFFFK